ncbi:MAG: hypothetical protein Greene041662_489 [Candidatus Peregrinibacteria bacterium Greene0416_62]|nr:MAG: hypothetical protein Greene041662_489 [Candidatus Peregrinibacteria bacterium Greene0416_62]TSC97792.1 MAG: hypothetical protein Greene101449_1087 [Candidatus Peregrinibacteria bacterium Greene1014_49]
MDTFEWRMEIVAPLNPMVSVLEIDERTHEALGGNGEVQQLEALIETLSQGRGRFRLVLEPTSSDVVFDAKPTSHSPTRVPKYGDIADDMSHQFSMSDYTGGGQVWSYDR